MRAVQTRVDLLVAVVALVRAALPGQARALDSPPTANCAGGGCGGWFRSDVTVSWSFNGSGGHGHERCGAAPVGEDTTGATFTCTVNYGGSFVGSSVTVPKDSTPPSVTTASCRVIRTTTAGIRNRWTLGFSALMTVRRAWQACSGGWHLRRA